MASGRSTSVTRTIGPLHLEDLEPHRFEDLVRQLAYDFRDWRVLEPTGRGGSDDGFDARGEEFVHSVELSDIEDGETAPDDATGPIWLIQCKRERTIPPARLAKHLAKIDFSGVHGLIFAAATDFSKASRDKFREFVRGSGLAEAHLWGKADIEDMLFQPKNDHLLFAYFGISLQIRRRSVKSDVRLKLAAKRKAERLLRPHQMVLIRDPSDTRYPRLGGSRQTDRHDRGRWRVFRYLGNSHDGLQFATLEQFFVCRTVDGQFEWDRAERMNDAIRPGVDRWGGRQLDPSAGREEALTVWEQFPPKDRGIVRAKEVLPFEHVADIDATGDEYFLGPHIYVDRPFHPLQGPFTRQELEFDFSEERSDADRLAFRDSDRVEFFARL